MMNILKRLLSGAAAAAVLLQTCVLAPLAHADGDFVIDTQDICTYSAGLVPGYTLEADGAENDAEIVWETSAQENGAYSEVSTGKTYTLLNAQANKWIRARAGDKTSNAMFVGGALSYYDAISIWSGTAPQKGPEQYRFTIDGAEYIVLDEREIGGEKQYFIYRSTSLGNSGFDNGGKRFFDVNNENNIAYKMNTKGEELYDAIETDIKKYVIRNDWVTCRGGGSAQDIKNSYVTYAEFSLLASQDLKNSAYMQRVGYDDLYSAGGTSWLREPHSSDKIRAVWKGTSNDGYSQGRVASTKYEVHPICWIGEDFFANAKLDAAGSDVLDIIKSKGTRMEYIEKGIYTAEELDAIGYLAYGAAENVRIAGNIAAGSTVKAEYVYNNKGRTEDKGRTEFIWYRADSEDGSYTQIDGAGGDSYTIPAEDIGKFLKVRVNPVDSQGERADGGDSLPTAAVRGVQTLAADTGVITKGTNTVSASFNINNTGDAADVTMIIAVYTQNNSLVKMNVENAAVAPGEGVYTVTLDEYDDTAGYICRAFIIENKENMKPLSAVKN